MNIALLSLLTLTLFMLHEFEEIIGVRAWIRKNGRTQRFQSQLWIRQQAQYPSTATLTAMIAEEFLLAAILLVGAVVWSSPELVAAILIGHGLHLIGHAVDALRWRRWVPGSLTAAVTLPAITAALVWFFSVTAISWLTMAWMVPLIMAIIVLNLLMMFKFSPRIQAGLDRLIDRHY